MAKSIQVTKRNVPIEQIIAIQGQSPVASGVDMLGKTLGSVLARKAELQRQGQQLAQLESLAGQQPGSFSGLDPSTAAAFAQTGMKQNYDTQEEAKKLIANEKKIRALESQFGYPSGSLGDDHPSALLKVQNDLINKRQNDGAAAQNREMREEQFRDKQLMAYSKQLQTTGIPGAVATAQEILNQLPERGENIPGYGPLEQYKPNFLAGDEGRRLRQAVGQLFNIELKTRSGVAVTDPELQRLKVEFGQGNFATEESLRNGIRQFLNRMSQIARNVDAGVTSNIKQKYIEEGGQDIPSSFDQMLKLQKIAEPKPKTITPTVVDGYKIRVKK